MTLFNNFSHRDWLLFSGNSAMLLCSISYILWWINANKTGSYHPDSASLLFATIGFGIAAVTLITLGMRAPSVGIPAVPVWSICAGAAVLYCALYVLAAFVFHRPTTSELLIMIIWLMGELCVLDVLHADGRFGTVMAVLYLVLIVLAFCAGFVCYLKYYHLAGRAMVVDGIIPLAADGFVVVLLLIGHAFL